MEDAIVAALDTVARKKCKHGFHIDKADKNQLLHLARSTSTYVDTVYIPECIVSCTNMLNKNVQVSHTSQGSRQTSYESSTKAVMHIEGGGSGNVEGMDIGGTLQLQVDRSATRKREESHVQQWKQTVDTVPSHTHMEAAHGEIQIPNKIKVCVQADFVTRVYPRKPVKVGAAVGGGVGGAGGAAAGGTGGAAVGFLIGASLGSVVPGVGNIVGGILGGVIGGIGGVAVGGGAGAGIGAGVGAIHSNVNWVTITAKEVFQELPHFSENEKNNTVSCVLLENSTAFKCSYDFIPSS